MCHQKHDGHSHAGLLHRCRDRGRERGGGGGSGYDRGRRDERSGGRGQRESSAERRAKIASWNKVCCGQRHSQVVQLVCPSRVRACGMVIEGVITPSEDAQHS